MSAWAPQSVGNALEWKRLEQEARPFAEQLPRGRLIEITTARGGGQMTTAVACLRHAQREGETAAWVQLVGGTLYPPDLAVNEIDLDALIIVQVPKSVGAHGIGKAAELLLRSGGFGFVVLDLVGACSNQARLSHNKMSQNGLRQDLSFQGRLLGLAREHDCTLVLLTEVNAQGSFGPLVSVCVEPERTRVAAQRFAITHRVRKDKTHVLSALEPEPARIVF